MKVTASSVLVALVSSLGIISASGSSASANPYGSNFFVDSQSTYYDGYQQAWRYLGWYVKCGYPSDRYEDEESGDHESGEGGEGGEGGERELGGSYDNQYQGNNYCQRFLIWAAVSQCKEPQTRFRELRGSSYLTTAILSLIVFSLLQYIDENYQGGGTGEYFYYDPYSQSWDYSACEAHGNGRCAPMDCHDNNSTTWKLMGVFKEASYFGNDAFFEQLFKHEGYCVWNDEDVYEFMSTAREESWTQGCVSTGVQGNEYYYDSNDGGYNYLYLDLKPTWNGNMTYGLYTDSACKTEYEGLDVSVDTVSQNMGLLYGSYLEQWNDGLEVYKVCQPCRAYNLANNYDMGYQNNGNRRLDGDYSYYNDVNEGYFQCNDDADYTNVNQCMKFRTHAELEVATWEDLVTATNQGGILEVKVGGTVFGSERMSAEMYEYMLMQRRKGLAEEARKAKRQANSVRAMEPKANAWMRSGSITVAVGAFVLLASFIRVCAKRHKESKKRNLSEPLLFQ